MASQPSLVQGLAQRWAAQGSLDAWQGHKALLGLARDVAFPPDTIIAPTSQPTGSRSSATTGTHAQLPISSRLLPTRHSLLFPVTSGSLLAGRDPIRTSASALLGSSPHSGTSLSTTRAFFSLPTWQEVKEPGRTVTNALLVANTATFLWSIFLATAKQKSSMYMVPYLVVQGEYLRLLTSGFMHGGIIHLAVNMLTLHFMGAAVERKTGPARFSLIYFTALISGGVLQCALSPAFSAACGASGATMGLMGAFAMYRWRNKHFVGYTPEDVQWVGQVAMMNVMLAFVFGNSIGHWSHLGGVLGGVASMFLFGPRYIWRNGRVVDAPIIPLLPGR